MKIEDALRKIHLLKQIRPENGASAAEAEAAANLAKSLMDRFAVKSEELRAARPLFSKMSWVYWDQLVDEYGLTLTHFGKRGSVRLGDRLVHIRLDSGEWRLQRQAAGGWETLAQGEGVESFRSYLSKNGPRKYSFSKGGPGGFRPR